MVTPEKLAAWRARSGLDLVLQAEKQPICDGDAPRRFKKPGPREGRVLAMKRGQWCKVLSKREAQKLREAAMRLGGSAVTYRISEMAWCFKVLEAPWVKG